MARALNKTTMAKVMRERRLQERRADKEARRARRRDERTRLDPTPPDLVSDPEPDPEGA